MAVQHVKLSARAILAERIRTLRKTKRMTQEDLSAATGITRSHISAIEQARSNIRLDNMEKIAAALGVPLHQLLDQPLEDAEAHSRSPLHVKEQARCYAVTKPPVMIFPVTAGTL